MKNYAITLLAGFMLAACSSGGGGSSNPAQPSPPQPPKTAKSIDSVQDNLKAKVIEEKTIDIYGQMTNIADMPEGWVNIEKVGDNYYVRGYNLPYLAAGYALPQDVNIDEYGRVVDNRVKRENFDVYGLTTQYADKPTSGSATYNGVSFGANSEGKLELTANFADNTVEGRLFDRKNLKDKQALPEITLEKGAIVNEENIASFTGTAKATIDGNVVRTPYAGAFGGPKAEEAAGAVFDDRDNPYEAFIGKK